MAYIQNSKIEQPTLKIDADHLHLNLVAKPITPFVPLADQAVRGVVEVVIIVRQRADVNQPFNRQRLGLGEKAVIRHAGDDGVELQAQRVLMYVSSFSLTSSRSAASARRSILLQ